MKSQSFKQKKETPTRGKRQSKELEKTFVKYTWQKISIKDALRAIKLKQQPFQSSSQLKEIMNWTKNSRRKKCRKPVSAQKSVQLFFREEQIKTFLRLLSIPGRTVVTMETQDNKHSKGVEKGELLFITCVDVNLLQPFWDSTSGASKSENKKISWPSYATLRDIHKVP